MQDSGQREKFTTEETKRILERTVLEEIRVDGIPRIGALRWSRGQGGEQK